MQAGASQPCAVVPGQRPWCEHDMRAARCEWEVLNRLLSIEQVWTARIDAGHECIEYISLDGTTDRTNSFPLGSKVGDIGLGLGWDCAEVTTIYGEVLDPTWLAQAFAIDQRHVLVLLIRSAPCVDLTGTLTVMHMTQQKQKR